MNATAPPVDVLVLVGTDHHPFDRLVEWVDAWAATRGDARVVIQHGTSRAPTHAEGRELLTREVLDDVLATAPVMVTHGGPGTIADGRDVGIRPIVVPRDPRFGEHVDGHQVAFARRMDDAGAIVVARTPGQLHQLLDAALADRDEVRFDPADTAQEVADATSRFAASLEALHRRRRRRLPARPFRASDVLGDLSSGRTDPSSAQASRMRSAIRRSSPSTANAPGRRR